MSYRTLQVCPFLLPYGSAVLSRNPALPSALGRSVLC